MKRIEFNQLELVNGGGFCQAVAVADAVATVGAAAIQVGTYYGAFGVVAGVAVNPITAPVLLGVAGVGLVGLSLYCAFS